MIIDRKGMQKIESLSGFSSLEIMETVSRLIADKIMHAFSKQDNIVVLAGKGNNGGDGYTICKYLKEYSFKILPIDGEPVSNEAIKAKNNIDPQSIYTYKKETVEKATAKKPATKKTDAKKPAAKKTTTKKTTKKVEEPVVNKKSVKDYEDIINWKKGEAHAMDWLYIEVNANDLLTEVEAGVDNLDTTCQAIMNCMLEGDVFVVEPTGANKVSPALSVRYYCDNLSEDRKKYFER